MPELAMPVWTSRPPATVISPFPVLE
jgi:hypothetical protein